MRYISSTPIARGRTAEIHPWKQGWVLKLYYDWFKDEDVHYEARIARAVHESGMPVPAPGEILEVGGRLGLSYQRIEGETMLDEILSKPWSLFRQARRLAELHVNMHAIRTHADLPHQHEKLGYRIKEAPGLQTETKKVLLNALEGLPAGDRLCHGDFHPGNVLLTPSGPVVIDWIDAARGRRLADVARTSVLLLGQRATEVKGSLRLLIGWGHRIYLRHYFRLSPRGEREYRTWIPIVAAARLTEGIPELQEWLGAQAVKGAADLAWGE